MDPAGGAPLLSLSGDALATILSWYVQGKDAPKATRLISSFSLVCHKWNLMVPSFPIWKNPSGLTEITFFNVRLKNPTFGGLRNWLRLTFASEKLEFRNDPATQALMKAIKTSSSPLHIPGSSAHLPFYLGLEGMNLYVPVEIVGGVLGNYTSPWITPEKDSKTTAMLCGITAERIARFSGLGIVVSETPQRDEATLKHFAKSGTLVHTLSTPSTKPQDLPTSSHLIILGTPQQIKDLLNESQNPNFPKITILLFIDAIANFGDWLALRKPYPFQVISNSSPLNSQKLLDIACVEEDYSESDFDEMLPEPLLRATYQYGFERASKVQRIAVPIIRSGCDTFVSGGHGTGKKTSAILSALCFPFDLSKDYPQVMFVGSRTVTADINSYIPLLAAHLNLIPCVHDKPKESPQIHVTTTGRCLDSLQNESKKSIFDHIKKFYLFIDVHAKNVDLVVDLVPLLKDFNFQKIFIFDGAWEYAPERDILAPYIDESAWRWVTVRPEEKTLEGIRNYYISCEKEEWKLEVICDLYDTITIAQAVIYCPTTTRVKWLQAELLAKDFTVAAIHAELGPAERKAVMEDFRRGAQSILIVTPLFARNLDIQSVTLALFWSFPQRFEEYITCVGRSGKFGRKGVVITLVTEDKDRIREYERFYNTHFDELPADFANFL